MPISRLCTTAVAVAITVASPSMAPAHAVQETSALQLTLHRSDGSTASDALALLQVVGPGHQPKEIHVDTDGLLAVSTDTLLSLASPAEVAAGRVNYVVRAYDLPEITAPGTYPTDVAMITFVLDVASGTIANRGLGGNVTMRRENLEFEGFDANCPNEVYTYATCSHDTFFDADLQNIEIPFIDNYGGGLDWHSKLVITSSKTILSESMVKFSGGASWAKATGKLTTSETDTVTVAAPETPGVGNVKFGSNREMSQMWEFVRERVKTCGYAGFFCRTDEMVRPWEWTGGTRATPIESPSYPYDQAGAPGIGNSNCTREYSVDVDFTRGHDYTQFTTIQFGASGGFRDEVGIEVEWQSSTKVGNSLSHNYRIVGNARPRHFLFTMGGWLIESADGEPACPENATHMAYTDAATIDLTNPPVVPLNPGVGVDCSGLPPQIQRFCDVRAA